MKTGGVWAHAWGLDCFGAGPCGGISPPGLAMTGLSSSSAIRNSKCRPPGAAFTRLAIHRQTSYTKKNGRMEGDSYAIKLGNRASGEAASNRGSRRAALMENAHFAYVKAYLEEHGADRDESPGLRFRSRAGHIRRVAMWAERLMAQRGDADAEALRLAAAFHDVGYARGAENHGLHGAAILLEYARRVGLGAGLAERAAFLVAEHSNKEEWLARADAPYSLVLLMEADLLDEEGAMGLVRDCMSAGEMGAAGYEDAYARMLRFEPARLAANPMRTPLARRLWAEKQHVIAEFMAAFAHDLGESC